MAEVELRLPPDYRFVSLARLVVVAAARNAGMDEARREDLRIAVSEATTSAIAALGGSAAADPVVLRFGRGEGGFRVTVRGAGREPGRLGGAGGGWPGDNGLATTLIEGLADQMEFVPGEDRSVDLRFALSLTDSDGDGAAGGAHQPGAAP